MNVLALIALPEPIPPVTISEPVELEVEAVESVIVTTPEAANFTVDSVLVPDVHVKLEELVIADVPLPINN